MEPAITNTNQEIPRLGLGRVLKGIINICQDVTKLWVLEKAEHFDDVGHPVMWLDEGTVQVTSQPPSGLVLKGWDMRRTHAAGPSYSGALSIGD